MGASVELDAGEDDHAAPACLVLQTRTFALTAFDGEVKIPLAINRPQCAILAQWLSIWIDERIALNELLRERKKMISFRLGQRHALYLRRKLRLLGEQNPQVAPRVASCSSNGFVVSAIRGNRRHRFADKTVRPAISPTPHLRVKTVLLFRSTPSSNSVDRKFHAPLSATPAKSKSR